MWDRRTIRTLAKNATRLVEATNHYDNEQLSLGFIQHCYAPEAYSWGKWTVQSFMSSGLFASDDIHGEFIGERDYKNLQYVLTIPKTMKKEALHIPKGPSSQEAVFLPSKKP
jgi:hypothetical protein